jgi:hypothetical protein
LLFFNQTAAVLFPNSKLLFFGGTFFQQDSQKKLPGHNTTQHKTTVFKSQATKPQNLDPKTEKSSKGKKKLIIFFIKKLTDPTTEIQQQILLEFSQHFCNNNEDEKL